MARVLMQAKVEPEVKAWLLVSENRRTRLWTTLIGAFIPPQIMNFSLDLSSPQAVAAIVAGVVSILVGLITAVVTCYVMIVKFRLDNRTVFQAELAARELMMNPRWQWRTFEIIRHHLGGFKDNDLRQILVRAGAIRTKAKNGKEVWGLLDRNKDFLGVSRPKTVSPHCTLSFTDGRFADPVGDGKSLKPAPIDDRRRGHDEPDAAALGRSLRSASRSYCQ